jgi:23S rRNA pseudouridine2605 synthase
MTIYEGRNRQIRRMTGIVGLNLLELKRVAIGTLQLGELKSGEYRHLTDEEVAALKSEV